MYIESRIKAAHTHLRDNDGIGDFMNLFHIIVVTALAGIRRAFDYCPKHIFTREYFSNPSAKTLSKHAYVRGYTNGTIGMPVPSRVLPLVAPMAPMVPLLPTIGC